MSLNFTSLAEKYDAAAVEEDIANLEQELADELAVEAQLSKDSNVKSADVQAFMDANSDIVNDQYRRMKSLAGDLKTKIASNMELEAADAEYKALVESEQVQNLALKMAQLDAISVEYHDLLKKTGREGRPPLN